MDNFDILFKTLQAMLTFAYGILLCVVRKSSSRVDQNVEDTKELERKMNVIQLDIAKNYIGKSDFNGFKQELFSRLDSTDKAIQTLLSQK